MRRWHIHFLALLVLWASNSFAGDWKHAVQACDDAAKRIQVDQGADGAQAAGHVSLLSEIDQLRRFAITKLDHRFPWEDCVIKLGTLDWLAPTFANIAPGSGFAPGLRTQHEVNHGETESLFIARGYYSLKNFYFMEGRYDRHFPLPHDEDEKATVSLFARRMDLHRQDFYGLGPDTTSSELAEYRQQQDEVGVTTYLPVQSLCVYFTRSRLKPGSRKTPWHCRWLAAGGTLQTLIPSVHGISDLSVRSVENFFPPSQLPGFSNQPVFLNPQAFVRFHTPFTTDQTWNNTDVRITYDHFQDLGSGTFTFDKLQAFVVESFELRFNLKRGGLIAWTKSWWKNALCQGIVGDQCRAGNLVLDGLVTTSYTGTGRSVPFYFQDTLGGSDIHGLDTLRGLVDYRLRAPNRMLLQADFYHDIWGPIGILGFADTGRVALVPSDLAFSHLRHDFGVGAYIRAGGNIVLRAYIGFGAGEGSHPNVKFFNAF
jgi:hypothetical protein